MSATKWSIQRKKTRDGMSYPIRLEFKQPKTEADVRWYIEFRKRGGDRDFARFSYFEMWPTE